MKIDQRVASAILKEEAAKTDAGHLEKEWEAKVEKLSQLCADGTSSTHIAFLGTAILAKSVNKAADLYAIKPTLDPENENAYSARSLCHGVLVPGAADVGISLGVTGREPLNNQPYFRMTRLGDNTPVHVGGRAAFNYMLELIKELSELQDEQHARQALQAFIAIRRRYQPRYTVGDGKITLTPERLVSVIAELVGSDSEGGKRAQAVVAGLFDVFAGTGRVESGRINDPSRKHPGDVCICVAEDPEKWEKAIEVKDKPMSESDVRIFAKKCVDMGAREAATVMVADNQPMLDGEGISAWASTFGIGVTLFYGWQSLVEQVLFWAELPKPEAALVAIERIEARLVAVEASAEAVRLWQSLVRA